MDFISGARPVTNRSKFWLLSLSWGLPMTLAGLLVGFCLLLTGHRPRRWGPCFCFEVGKDWGGMDWGPVFLVYRGADEAIKNHEMGHAMQNCRFGFLMPFLVGLPSSTRWWYRFIREKLGKKAPKTPYESVWFEKQATRLGYEYQSRMGRP